MRFLNVARCNMPNNPKQFSIMLDAIKRNEPSLTDLDVSALDIDDADARQLAGCLPYSTHIKSLNLRSFYITRYAADILFDVFLATKRFRHISLRINTPSQLKAIQHINEFKIDIESYNEPIYNEEKKQMLMFMLINNRGIKFLTGNVSVASGVKRVKCQAKKIILPTDCLQLINKFLKSKPKTMDISF